MPRRSLFRFNSREFISRHFTNIILSLREEAFKKYIAHKTQVGINDKPYFVSTFEAANFCRFTKKRKCKEISQ